MLFNFQLYLQTIFFFASWLLKPSAYYLNDCLTFTGFSYIVRIFRIENLQEARLFNYFYLARYFLGHRAQVFFLKRYFILGRTYYNTEIGFHLPCRQINGTLAVWVFQIQPLANLGLTRDFVISHNKLQ